VAIDATGSIYVADTGNHTIRKITSDRVVTTIAGFPGSQGSADGTGDYARFRFPGGVAVDDGGNLFVTDTRNHTIRKITPAAVVTTFAGSPGLAGQQNGFGSAASFSSPRGITIASSGIMYVADTGSHVIRGITPDRNVTRLAGFFGAGAHWDGTGSTARFASPEGVAVDAAGNVYVADTQNFLIRKVTPEGVTSTLGGFGGFPNSPTEQHPGSRDGTGPASRFFSPRGVTVGADGALFIADSLNNSIRRGQLAPLSFTRALSRKIHTGNRTLDVDLALTGTPTVEPRTGGLAGNHTLVVDFSTNMSQAEATIVGGSAGLSAPASASGTAIVVNLASAADAQIVEIAISNATDSLGRTLPPFSVRLGLLLGDVNNDGSVNAGDALVARNRSGQQANTANLRSDLNLDGVTNSGDALIVRSRSGSTLP
jgi:sugar lactone lactonase YvrE